MASSGTSNLITGTRSNIATQRKEQGGESDAETEISAKSMVQGMDDFLDARSNPERSSFDIDSDDEPGHVLRKSRDPRFNNHPTPRKPPPKSRFESDPFPETLSRGIQENSTPMGNPTHSSTAKTD